MSAQPITIVIAEDDEGHAALIQMNLRRAGVINQMVHVQDGQELLDYLGCEGAFADRDACHPMLVLLDLNMPRLDGVETLRRLKADPRTAKIPVLILTTTDDPREIEHCYQLGCSAYITKPVEYETFSAAIRELGQFLQFVSLPSEVRKDRVVDGSSPASGETQG